MRYGYDYLIVGAGFSGLVFAERLARLAGKSSLVIDKRSHLGGNCHDEYDQYGVLYHKYGPHYFRTNSERIQKYLSQFTEWLPVQYKVLSWTEGRYWSFPVNLKTYEQLIGKTTTEEDFKKYLEQKSLKLDGLPRNSEEAILSQCGDELYQKFFKNYTLKQWQRYPRELDASVCGRIPIRTSRDDRYFSDTFQALPKQGYHNLFKNIVSSSPKITVVLNADFDVIRSQTSYGHLVFTGPVDHYFRYCYGPLPYRSLRFELEHIKAAKLRSRTTTEAPPGFWQPALQVNYPNDNAYTRIVELKHATQQAIDATTIVREYPETYEVGGEAYYPIPASDAQKRYVEYQLLAKKSTNVTFLGRLATYRYLNMDQVVGMAIAEANKHIENHK